MSTPKGTKPWNAGTGKGWLDARGYRWIYVVENGRRRAKREHRHVMEQTLGRPLAHEELVHHKNGNKSDNRPENLEVMGWSEHSIDHLTGSKQSTLAKQTQEVIASYREENKRLKLLKTQMLEALRKVRAALGEASRGDIRYTPLLLEADDAIAAATGGEQ